MYKIEEGKIIEVNEAVEVRIVRDELMKALQNSEKFYKKRIIILTKDLKDKKVKNEKEAKEELKTLKKLKDAITEYRTLW